MRKAFTILAGVLAVVFLFRLQIFSGFEYLVGKILDGRLILVIVDHWRQVFAEGAPWKDIPAYWPERGTLGYSDTFFFHGIIYNLLRLTGMGQYTAFSLTFVLLAALGFGTLYVLLRRFMDVPRPIALLSSALFINLAPTQTILANTHLQLCSIWLCPGLILLGWNAVRKNSPVWAALFGAGLALTFFTTYYIPWFCALFCMTCAGVFAVTGSIRVACVGGGLKAVANLPGKVLRLALPYWKTGLSFAAAFVVFLIPFAVLYLPVVKSRGGRTIADALDNLPRLPDFLNTGADNPFWGWINQSLSLDTRPMMWELHYGLPVLTLLAFLAATGLLARSLFRERPGTLRFQAACAGIAVLLCWLLMLRVGNSTLWRHVLDWVPGASGVRAVFRFNVVLSAVAIVVCAVCAKDFWERGGRTAKVLLLAGLCLLFAEQVSPPSTQYIMVRSELDAFMSKIQPPPADARVFFVLRRNWENEVVDQNNAMCLSQRFGIPTINGQSGMTPVNWNLAYPLSSDYLDNVRSWLRAHGSPQGVYCVMLDEGTWNRFDY
jgi:hypothetical protein